MTTLKRITLEAPDRCDYCGCKLLAGEVVYAFIGRREVYCSIGCNGDQKARDEANVPSCSDPMAHIQDI